MFLFKKSNSTPTPTHSSRIKKHLNDTTKVRSFEQEREHANDILKKTLDRAVNPDVEKQVVEQDGYQFVQNEKEKRQQRFLKRWALLLAHGYLQIGPDDAKKYGMSIAQIIGCGARASIVFDGVDNRIINWLFCEENEYKASEDENVAKTTGPKSNKNNVSSEYDKTGNQIIHTRAAGTHGFGDGNDKDNEIKTKDPRKAVRADGRHLGVNLAIGGRGELDIHGRPITMDGLSGHAYIHIAPQTNNILLGMEACKDPSTYDVARWFAQLGPVEGQFGTHTPLGGAEDVTAFGTIPFGNYPHDYKDEGWKKLPKTKENKYNTLKIYFKESTEDKIKKNLGIEVETADDRVKRIISLKPDDYKNNLGEALPCSSMEDIQVFEEEYKDKTPREPNTPSSSVVSPAICSATDSDKTKEFILSLANLHSVNKSFPDVSNEILESHGTKEGKYNEFKKDASNPELLEELLTEKKKGINRIIKGEIGEVFNRPERYSGIGVETSYEYQDGVWTFTIIKVYEDSPAQKGGLVAGDKITAQQTKKGVLDEKGRNKLFNEAVNKIRDNGINLSGDNSSNRIIISVVKQDEEVLRELEVGTAIFQKDLTTREVGLFGKNITAVIAEVCASR